MGESARPDLARHSNPQSNNSSDIDQADLDQYLDLVGDFLPRSNRVCAAREFPVREFSNDRRFAQFLLVFRFVEIPARFGIRLLVVRVRSARFRVDPRVPVASSSKVSVESVEDFRKRAVVLLCGALCRVRVDGLAVLLEFHEFDGRLCRMGVCVVSVVLPDTRVCKIQAREG